MENKITMEKQQWRPFKMGRKNYQISNQANVKNETGEILDKIIIGSGYAVFIGGNSIFISYLMQEYWPEYEYKEVFTVQDFFNSPNQIPVIIKKR